VGVAAFIAGFVALAGFASLLERVSLVD
jgi:hypothetical protein